MVRLLSRFFMLLGVCLLSPMLAAAEPTGAEAPSAHDRPHAKQHHGAKAKDKRIGKASYYSNKLAGKTMADGTPMKPQSNAAASKTLPLGTKARVTNLKTGKSAVVEIRDRGPYVKGRIVDVSPKTAKELGMGKSGVTRVEVVPLETPKPAEPQPNKSVFDGEAGKAPKRPAPSLPPPLRGGD